MEIKDDLTTEHELYISVGLKTAVKPSKFREMIDTLLFENIGYMQSWGVHTKGEYIGIIDKQSVEIERLKFDDEERYALHLEIARQQSEIERYRQALVDSSYIIDRLINDYPSESWAQDEVRSWVEQGKQQMMDNKAALE